MKKHIAILSIAAIALTATPVFAKEGQRGSEGKNEKIRAEIHAKAEGRGFGLIKSWFKNDDDRFVIRGTVSAVSSTSISVTDAKNGATVIALDAETKFKSGRSEIAAADVKVGDKVWVSGSKEGSGFEADYVIVMQPKPIAMGTVTAKSDTSVTVKNAVTGAENTITVNEDTKVKINGETKAMADVQVGDSGWVKFKTEAGVLIAKFINLFR